MASQKLFIRSLAGSLTCFAMLHMKFFPTTFNYKLSCHHHLLPSPFRLSEILLDWQNNLNLIPDPKSNQTKLLEIIINYKKVDEISLPFDPPLPPCSYKYLYHPSCRYKYLYTI